MSTVPDLATHAPLWLSLLTVGVNALVGGLHGMDDANHWDVVGVGVFALLMGLGGGFVRDVLLGRLPPESLRGSRYLVAVLVGALLAYAVGEPVRRLRQVMIVLDAIGLGLFAVVGTSDAIDAGLPAGSAVLVGVVSSVGGGMLVSIVRGEVSSVLLASRPVAIPAVMACLVYLALRPWKPILASLLAVAAVVAAQFVIHRWGLRTRPATPLRRGRRDRPA